MNKEDNKKWEEEKERLGLITKAEAQKALKDYKLHLRDKLTAEVKKYKCGKHKRLLKILEEL